MLLCRLSASMDIVLAIHDPPFGIETHVQHRKSVKNATHCRPRALAGTWLENRMKNERRRMDIRKWKEYCCIYYASSVVGSVRIKPKKRLVLGNLILLSIIKWAEAYAPKARRASRCWCVCVWCAWLARSTMRIWERALAKPRRRWWRRILADVFSMRCAPKKVNFKILFISSGPFQSMSPASVHNLLSLSLMSLLRIH